jgi:hypothetical protein
MLLAEGAPEAVAGTGLAFGFEWPEAGVFSEVM